MRRTPLMDLIPRCVCKLFTTLFEHQQTGPLMGLILQCVCKLFTTFLNTNKQVPC